MKRTANESGGRATHGVIFTKRPNMISSLLHHHGNFTSSITRPIRDKHILQPFPWSAPASKASWMQKKLDRKFALSELIASNLECRSSILHAMAAMKAAIQAVDRVSSSLCVSCGSIGLMAGVPDVPRFALVLVFAPCDQPLLCTALTLSAAAHALTSGRTCLLMLLFPCRCWRCR